MPLPKQNTVLIRDDLRERFEADLTRVSQANGATLVRPGLEEKYLLSDFERRRAYGAFWRSQVVQADC